MTQLLNQYFQFFIKILFLGLIWTLFGHFSYTTSINDPLTIELNNLLIWISRILFELNNILNWILGKAILNRILNESFFGKIQILNWIRLGIVHHYCRALPNLAKGTYSGPSRWKDFSTLTKSHKKFDQLQLSGFRIVIS